MTVYPEKHGNGFCFNKPEKKTQPVVGCYFNCVTFVSTAFVNNAKMCYICLIK